MEIKGHYKTKLDNGQCWRAFRQCPLGKDFLTQLYLWSEDNPLNPLLSWKICDPCEYKPEIREKLRQF